MHLPSQLGSNYAGSKTTPLKLISQSNHSKITTAGKNLEFSIFTGPQDALDALRRSKKEMVVMLALYSIEHLVLSIPIFILCYSISRRNLYLENKLYGQLPEEKVGCPSKLVTWLFRKMAF